MKYLIKKPFNKLTTLSIDTINDICKDLPTLKENVNNDLIKIDRQCNYDKFILDNWEYGSYQLNAITLNKLAKKNSIKEIKRILANFHKINNKTLSLKSSCIFIPKDCKYLFNLDNQNYLYHKYHLDSNYKIKALIMLEDSFDENQQFSYIEKFPEPLIIYYLKRHFLARISVCFQQLIYYVSLKKIKLSGQPPCLPKIYQDHNLYKKFNNLKKGQMITFHNLYPHCSHTGFSLHKSKMIQLVFDLSD